MIPAQDYLNPLCCCSLEIKDASHYLLHCRHFSHHRVVLMNSVKLICENFYSMSGSVKGDLLYTVTRDLMKTKNKVVLKTTMNYIKDTEKFSGSLFDY